MKPYYQSPDGRITLYHGDCRQIGVEADFLLTDPPYGIAERCDRLSRKRTALAACNDFPPIAGDEVPFDPSHLLGFRKVVLFGANFYADRLPSSATWLVWDKLNGLVSRRTLGFNDNADAELAWTNLGGPVRILSHRWMGMLKASEQRERRVHPTQKPVALMRRILQVWGEPSDVVLDPYAGSGPVLLAAADLGMRAIGIEIEERYCAIAARRLEVVFDGESTLKAA